MLDKSAGIFRHAYYLLLYLGGAILLLIAVTITGVRLALPEVERYRQNIESWVSDYTGRTLTIDKIHADWRGWRPRLYLSNVDLYGADNQRKIAGFERVALELSPWRSLLNRRLVTTRMTLSGLRVAVTRQPDGAIVVEGLELSPAAGDRHNEFADWLFRQGRIDLDQTELRWHDQKYEQPAIHISGASLSITGGKQPQVSLTTRLPAEYGDELKLVVNLAGQLHASDRSGRFYASVTNLRPDSWYRQYQMAELRPDGGRADLELWGRWDNAELRFLHGHARYRDFTLTAGDKGLYIEDLEGNFRGEQLRDDSWHLTMRLNRLLTKNGGWPVTDLEALIQAQTDAQAARYALAFDYLNPADLLPILAGQSWLTPAVAQALAGNTISGELRAGRLLYDSAPAASEPLVYEFALRDLTLGGGNTQPGVSGLTGSVHGSTRRASLHLQGAPGRFELPSLYPNELALDELRGVLHWSRQEHGWRLWTDRLLLRNADLSLAVRGSAQQQAGRTTPHLDLALELNSERLENLFRYVPLTPRFRMREWMQQSLHAGRVDSAIIVVRGHPDEFPFRDLSGQLQAVANVYDGILQYSPRWPAIDETTTELTLRNEKVTARLLSGRTFNARLLEGDGAIADLTASPKVVSARGRVSGSAQDLRALIKQSPLAREEALQYMQKTLVSGKVGMRLDLNIPIKAPHLKPAASGTLNLSGARLHSKESRLALNDVNGAFDFTLESIAGENLSARFAGQPVTLHVSGVKNNPDYPPALTINGHSAKPFIVEQLATRFPGSRQLVYTLGERLSGAIDWEARFRFERAPEGLRQYFDISSNLYGLAVDLPEPLGKPAYTSKPLRFTRAIAAAAATHLSYAPGLRMIMTPEQADRHKLKRLDVFLGAEKSVIHHPDMDGISLSGHLAELDLNKWNRLAAALGPAAGTDAEKNFFGAADLVLSLETDRLRAFGQRFDKVDVLARRTAQGWTASLQGETLAGQISVPVAPTVNNPVDVRLDRLALTQGAGNRTVAHMVPQSLPALRFHIADFTYSDYQLGNTHIRLSPTVTGVSFDKINFSSPDLTITGSGNWNKTGTTHYSDFDFTLEARRFKHMLETFNYDVTAIEKGRTSIALNAGWRGSPEDFSLANMNGSLTLSIRKGQLLEVSPAAGRLFGLLSLQALPRRLSLDFSDLFGKGLAFDSIKGDFRIEDGNAYTDNLRLSGPGADVAVRGRTGLIEQDYDQLVTVTPQFADNLPVASALLGPVGIGVGAALYLAGNVFESINENIDKLLSFQYTIKGDWYDPRVERAKDPAPDQQTQAQTVSQPTR